MWGIAICWSLNLPWRSGGTRPQELRIPQHSQAAYAHQARWALLHQISLHTAQWMWIQKHVMMLHLMPSYGKSINKLPTPYYALSQRAVQQIALSPCTTTSLSYHLGTYHTSHQASRYSPNVQLPAQCALFTPCHEAGGTAWALSLHQECGLAS